MRINSAATLILWLAGICELAAQPPCSHSRAIEAATRKSVDIDMTTLNDMRVGFMLNASVLDDWAKMGAEQQKKLRITAIFNLIQAVAASPVLPVNNGKINLPNGMASISTAQAQAMYKMLGNNGVQDPLLENLIYRASTLSAKPEAAEAGLKILDRLSLMTQTGIAAFGEDKVEALAPVAQFGLILMGPAYAGYALALGAGSDALTLIQAEFVERPAQEAQTKWLTTANEAGLVQLKSQMAKLQKDLQIYRSAAAQLDLCYQKNAVGNLALTGLWGNCQRQSNGYGGSWQGPSGDIDMLVDPNGMPWAADSNAPCMSFGACIYTWTKTGSNRYECQSGDNTGSTMKVTGVLEINGQTMRFDYHEFFAENSRERIATLTKKRNYICRVKRNAQQESGNIYDRGACQVACYDASTGAPIPRPVECD